MYTLIAPIPDELNTVLQPYRLKYDSQAILIPPHIAVVPPFVFSGEQQKLYSHLREIGESHSPIKVSLVGWDIHPYQGTYQLRLPLIGGKAEFVTLRQHILSGPLQYLAQPNRVYWPHVEFGQFANEAEAALAKNELQQFEPKFVFRAMYFMLLQRDAESTPWRLEKKFALEATVAGSRRRQSTPEPLDLNQLTRK